MSLTTHSPQESPCPACGAPAYGSEIITELLSALEESQRALLSAILFIEGVFPKLGRSKILKQELVSYRMREMKARVTINKVRSLLLKERKEDG